MTESATGLCITLLDISRTRTFTDDSHIFPEGLMITATTPHQDKLKQSQRYSFNMSTPPSHLYTTKARTSPSRDFACAYQYSPFAPELKLRSEKPTTKSEPSVSILFSIFSLIIDKLRSEHDGAERATFATVALLEFFSFPISPESEPPPQPKRSAVKTSPKKGRKKPD